MNLKKILIDQGLTDKEAVVFITLVELGETHPSAIARRSGLNRSTVYAVLKQLAENGLVSNIKRNNQLYFRTVDLNIFFEDRKEKFEELEHAMPKLKNLKSIYDSSPQITFYEGDDGIIQIMEDTLKTENKEILCWSSVDSAMETVFKHYHPKYVKKKNELGIWIRGLFQYEKSALKFKEGVDSKYREVFLIPKDKFPFENEINIYDNKMSIISHKDKIGVIIENAAIANTQRSIFNFAFEYARLLERDLLTDEDKAYLASYKK